MSPLRTVLRHAGFAGVIALAAYVVGANRTPAPVATQVGDAGLAVSGEVARTVEQVAYRQDVVRVGDVVLVDGQPAAPLTDPDLSAVWALVDHTWPASQRHRLVQLSVIDERPRGLVGVVHPSAATDGWILSLDMADLDDPYLLEETIVHELSHVVTLDRSVFTFGEEACDGARIELGCAASGSLLAEFATAFWPGGDGPDAVEHGGRHSHVNDYAATSVHEDLAETFTAMVMGWTPDGDVIDAKVAMLEADPELAALAAELRQALNR